MNATDDEDYVADVADVTATAAAANNSEGEDEQMRNLERIVSITGSRSLASLAPNRRWFRGSSRTTRSM